MRRLSIAELMALVAFLAANFGVLRVLLARMSGPDFFYEVLAGFVPLADALLLDAYSLASRNRVRLRSLGVVTGVDTPFIRYVVAPAFLGVSLSGPPLILTLVVAAALGRFTLVITPRKEEPCDASPSSP